VLPTTDDAYDMAESMPFDLAVRQADEMIGLEVAVSNTDGHELFSVPVKTSYLAAMPMTA
jgi:hypothetical protein